MILLRGGMRKISTGDRREPKTSEADPEACAGAKIERGGTRNLRSRVKATVENLREDQGAIRRGDKNQAGRLKAGKQFQMKGRCREESRGGTGGQGSFSFSPHT